MGVRRCAILPGTDDGAGVPLRDQLHHLFDDTLDAEKLNFSHGFTRMHTDKCFGFNPWQSLAEQNPVSGVRNHALEQSAAEPRIMERSCWKSSRCARATAAWLPSMASPSARVRAKPSACSVQTAPARPRRCR